MGMWGGHSRWIDEEVLRSWGRRNSGEASVLEWRGCYGEKEKVGGRTRLWRALCRASGGS